MMVTLPRIRKKNEKKRRSEEKLEKSSFNYKKVHYVLAFLQMEIKYHAKQHNIYQ